MAYQQYLGVVKIRRGKRERERERRKKERKRKKKRKKERKKLFSVDSTSETFCCTSQLQSTSQKRKYFNKNEDKIEQLNSLPSGLFQIYNSHLFL